MHDKRTVVTYHITCMLLFHKRIQSNIADVARIGGVASVKEPGTQYQDALLLADE